MADPQVDDHINSYVVPLPPWNPKSHYMGRTRNRNRPPAENGDDICRVITTLESLRIERIKTEVVERLAGYKNNNQSDLFSNHLSLLQDEGKIAITGNCVALTEDGQDYARLNETAWLKILIGEAKYQTFNRWCVANGVTHLLQFTHQAESNLEVLQRMVTFVADCLKGEKLIRHVFAHPNTQITTAYKNELEDRYTIPNGEFGRHLNFWIQRINPKKKPKQLLEDFFPEGRDSVIWPNQPVFAHENDEEEDEEEDNDADEEDDNEDGDNEDGDNEDGDPDEEDGNPDDDEDGHPDEEDGDPDDDEDDDEEDDDPDEPPAPAEPPQDGDPDEAPAPAEPPQDGKRRSSRKRKKPKLYGHS